MIIIKYIEPYYGTIGTECNFETPIGAAAFLCDRTVEWTHLIINGREYGWAPNLCSRRAVSLELTYDIMKHIQQCVELDEAFYESND